MTAFNTLRQLTTRLRFVYSPGDRAANRQYNAATQRTRTAVNGLAAANAKLAATQTAVNSAFAGSLKALGGYAAVLGIAFGGSEIVQAADRLDTLDNRLRAVVGPDAPLVSLRRELTRLSVINFSNLDDTVQIFQRFKIGTEDVGASTEAILEFTDSVQKAAALSGATTQESNAALIQFAQGIASNRFSGEELRSVSEQLPTLLRVLKRDLNLTTGELRELAFAGGLTSDVIFTAFENQRETIVKEFSRIQVTQQLAAQQLQTGLLTFFGRFGQGFGLNRKLAEFYQSIAAFLIDFQEAAFRAGRTMRGLFTLIFDFQAEVFSIFDPLFRNGFGIGEVLGKFASFFQIFATLRDSGLSGGEAFSEALSFFFTREQVAVITQVGQVLLTVLKSLLLLKVGGSIYKGIMAIKKNFKTLAITFRGFLPFLLLTAAIHEWNREGSKLKELWAALGKLWDGPFGDAIRFLANLTLALAIEAISGLADVFIRLAEGIDAAIKSINELFGLTEEGKQSREDARASVTTAHKVVSDFKDRAAIDPQLKNNLPSSDLSGQALLDHYNRRIQAATAAGSNSTSNHYEVNLNIRPGEVGEAVDSLERGGTLSNQVATTMRVGASGAN